MTAATLARRLDRVAGLLAARPAPTQSRLTRADMRRIPVQDREFLAAIAARCSVGANGRPNLDALADVELDRLAGIAELCKAMRAGRTDAGACSTGADGVPVSNLKGPSR